MMIQKKQNSLPPGSRPTHPSPIRSTLEIIALYTVLGVLWIFLSDRTLEWITGDSDIAENIQTAKGIFYVFVTAYLFYVIIKRRMVLYYQSIKDLNEVVQKLENSNTELTAVEEKLYNLAYFDPLTGLLSKNKLIERIDEIAVTNPDDHMAFVYIDIDDFRNINEFKGHDVGDHLIKLVGDEIRHITAAPDEVARIGGDEFVILLRGVQDKNRMMDLIRENASHIRKSFFLDGEEFFVTVSAGISLFPEHGRSFQSLVGHADLALITAKQRGKSQVVMYEEAFEARVLRQIEFSNLLHLAIPNGEILVYFQPIMDLRNHQITSMEALMRWKHPTRGFIPPLDFIPIAELSGTIHELTWHVIRECFRQQKNWEAEGIRMTVSINLSGKVLASPHFLTDLKLLIQETGVQPDRFAFEITESIAIDSMEETIGVLYAIKNLGFRLDLDDFGTGYSSLTNLHRLPIDVVKLDREFIKSIDEEGKTLPFLQSIIQLAHGLKMLVVSEGVEDSFQLEKLTECGSDFIQGYFYAKPMPADQVVSFLSEFQIDSKKPN